jgi:hypothetical protein
MSQGKDLLPFEIIEIIGVILIFAQPGRKTMMASTTSAAAQRMVLMNMLSGEMLNSFQEFSMSPRARRTASAQNALRNRWKHQGSCCQLQVL